VIVVVGSGFLVPNGGPIAHHLGMRGLRPLSRASLLGCVAAATALGYPDDPPGTGERRGVVLGTRWASLDPLFDFERSAAVDGPALVNPSHFPNVVVNVHAGYIAILFGLAGPNVTLCGPGAGLEAIAHAIDMLSLGRADYVLAGGVEAVGDALRQERGSDAGEGAAFLLLAREAEAPVARVAAFFSGPKALEQVAEKTAPVFIADDAAAGAMAAVRALDSVSRTGAPAIAADLSESGTQRVLILAPA
jgi:hypothetical protein